MDLGPTIFGGISTAQFAANLSTLTCPRAHTAAVPVDDVTGEHVAWLCPDCDKQLPAEWVPPAVHREAVLRDHGERHHGHPQVMLLQCRLCAEESGWKD
ncbi:MAG TPA: hypothetical protein VGP33_08775 [Chloroflexota bacterium]|nr:hypothetical protein [Chloroflexota bacterium]